jgi:hypothetical protein
MAASCINTENVMIALQLPEAGHDTDHRRAGAEKSEVGASNAAGPFVGHVREQAGDPEKDYKAQGASRWRDIRGNIGMTVFHNWYTSLGLQVLT